ADGAGVLRPDRTWQPRLAERAQTCCQPWIVSGEIPLHLLKDALLIHRQSHSATSRLTRPSDRLAGRPLPRFFTRALQTARGSAVVAGRSGPGPASTRAGAARSDTGGAHAKARSKIYLS